MRVTVIVNRRARHLRHPGPVLDALREPRPGVRLIETLSLTGLEGAAAAIARDPPDVVVLAGGDGSYMAGVTALAHAAGEERLSALPIALAPGGTASTVPRDWGWRGGGLLALGVGDATRRTRAIFDALRDLRTTTRPTLRVSDGETTRIGFIAGAGLVARFFEVYERKGAGGERTALMIVARIFAGSFVSGRTAREVLTPVPCTIEIDGARAPFGEASLFCASVIRNLGLGMRLLYRAAEEHDRFHVVATPASPGRLGPQMPLVLAGRPLRDPKIDALASTVRLRFPQGTGAYVLDGELLRSDELVVTAGPVLRILDVPSR